MPFECAYIACPLFTRFLSAFTEFLKLKQLMRLFPLTTDIILTSTVLAGLRRAGEFGILPFNGSQVLNLTPTIFNRLSH